MCNDECVKACDDSPVVREEKEIPLAIKSFTLVVNDTEIEITAQDIRNATKEGNDPWVLRRIYNDEDLLRAALLKLAK